MKFLGGGRGLFGSGEEIVGERGAAGGAGEGHGAGERVYSEIPEGPAEVGCRLNLERIKKQTTLGGTP